MIRNKLFIVYSLFTLLAGSPAYGSIVLKGDVEADSSNALSEQKSLSFPVYAHSSESDALYIGGNSQGGKNYALSCIKRNVPAIIPMAPEKVTLDGIEDVPNPCFNATFSHVQTILSEGNGIVPAGIERPVVITHQDPASLYLIENHNPSQTIMLSIKELNDAHGDATHKIVGLEATQKGAAGVFAAVPKAGGTFGDVGSGIAIAHLLRKSEVDLEEEQLQTKNRYHLIASLCKHSLDKEFKRALGLAQIAARRQYKNAKNIHQENDKQNAEQASKRSLKKMVFCQHDAQQEGPFSVLRAAPLDKTSSFLTIKNQLAHMGEAVTFCWDALLRRLYIGLTVRSGVASDDGAKAIAVAEVDEKGKLIVRQFAPDSIFTPNAAHEIFGTAAPDSTVAIHTLKTMHTSTSLPYLIVHGGNGDDHSTRSTVYALPIATTVNEKGIIANPALHGVLASKHSEPKVEFTSGGKKSIVQRIFMSDVAERAKDIFTTARTADGAPTTENLPAHVGGGPLQAGAIDEIIASKDAVFAVVSKGAPNQLPGIFHSQALFDEQGRIKAWTQWQRVVSEPAGICGASYDSTMGNFTYMVGDGLGSTTIKRTVWSEGDQQKTLPLTQKIAPYFPLDRGGIQGMFDFKYQSPALGNSALMIFTGFEKVILAQIGATQEEASAPFLIADGEQSAHSSSDALKTHVNSPLLVFSGPDLAALGPVVAADITAVGGQGLLFIGGPKGLAVLQDKDGNGWNAADGLGINFNNLPLGMKFKKIGEYKNIRSLLHDDNYLYVLTNSTLERLDLTQEGFPATKVAQLSHFKNHTSYDFFTDCVVSGNFALVATNQGLWRVGNGNDIRTVTKATDVGWTNVPINDGAGRIIQLMPISVTGNPSDIARYNGGNLYVLTGNQKSASAHINRFSIKPTDCSGVTTDTVLPFNDFYFKGVPTALAQLRSYRSTIASDGALFLHIANRNGTELPVLNSGYARRYPVTIPLSFTETSTIVRVARSSALGNWIVVGDNGLFVNE